MAINLETLEIQFKANVASAANSIKQLEGASKRLKNGKMKVTADTKDAENQLKKVQKTASSMEDTTITVDADTSKAVSAFSKLGNIMKAYGLIQGAKKVFTIAVDLVETSYSATSAQNRLNILLPEKAQAEIRAYAEEMKQQYGLNETGLISMTTNFASAYVGMGVEAEQAARYAERLTSAAIDYASALDKTPSEVGEIIMSLMRGNTAVADNIGLFGLTVDKLNKQADELKADGLVPQNMAEGTEKYIALLREIERNADAQGFTGDWARTFEEYGNQTTVLGEQWQTLKENVGSFLEPAATAIVKALNDIMAEIIEFTSGTGTDTTISDAAKAYFGDYEMTEQEITDLVNSITKPTNDMVAAMQQSRTDLGKAYLEYDSALNGFVSLLNKLYVGGKPITDDQKENLFEAWDAAETAGINGPGGVFDSLKTTLTAMFTTLSGDISGEVGQAGIALIQSYFDAMQEEAMKQSIELTTAMHNALQDGVLTSDEMQDINAKVAAVNKSVYEGYDIAVGAESARYVDTHNFQASSESWLEFYKQATGASAEARAKLEEQYGTLEIEMYKMAEYMAKKYEEWGPELYKEKTGLDRVYSGAELMQLSKENLAATLNQMDADTLGKVARSGLAQIVGGSMEKIKSGGMTNRDFIDDVMLPILEQGDFAARAKELQASGAKLDSDTLRFLSIYDFIQGMIPAGESIETMFAFDESGMIASQAEQLEKMMSTDLASLFSAWLGGSGEIDYGEIPASVPLSRQDFDYAAFAEDLPEAGDVLIGAAEELSGAASALSEAASKPVIVRVQYTGGSNYNFGRGTQNASDVFTAVHGP